MKQQVSNRIEPRDYLYDVGYKKKNGQEKILSKGVTIRKALKSIRNYRRLLDAGIPFAEEIEYVFMIPQI